MSSRNATIAAAVVSALNTAAATPDRFAKTFTAVRAYDPTLNVDKMALGTTYVHVVSKAEENSQYTRGGKSYEIDVDIGIREKLGSFTDGGKFDLAEVDELSEFAEQVMDFFSPGDLGTTAALFVKVERPAIYLPQHLHEHGVFTSVITVTYKLAL